MMAEGGGALFPHRQGPPDAASFLIAVLPCFWANDLCSHRSAFYSWRHLQKLAGFIKVSHPFKVSTTSEWLDMSLGRLPAKLLFNLQVPFLVYSHLIYINLWHCKFFFKPANSAGWEEALSNLAHHSQIPVPFLINFVIVWPGWQHTQTHISSCHQYTSLIVGTKGPPPKQARFRRQTSKTPGALSPNMM